jgi:GTP-binding protein LepA
MQPVRMDCRVGGVDYELNLIDTPGHIDFSYEVSRSLKAVEGVILLVDATQGVQAQTLTVLSMAREEGLVVIPVINKIDLPMADQHKTTEEIVKLLDCQPGDILAVSGKTGDGVEQLLARIVELVPPPVSESTEVGDPRALVFDFEYSTHRGVIVYIRVLDGEIKKGDQLVFSATREKFTVIETGLFRPDKQATNRLTAGEIGYVVTGIREPGQAKVGETILCPNSTLATIPGYRESRPVVWASIYPESQDDFHILKQAVSRLHLSDASFVFEEESSGSLGRGFRCGFLGMLHLEIITERLRREFNLSLIIASPTISYELMDKRSGKKEVVYNPQFFPDEIKDYEVIEPWIAVKIITPPDYLNSVMKMLYEHEAVVAHTEVFSDDRLALDLEMPLRELMRNFFDEVKSATSGYASFSYQLIGLRPADVVKLEVLVNEEVVPAFTKIVARRRVELEAEGMAERLKTLIPKQLIIVKIQTKALGRIIAARTISAIRKDVTDYLYGGDITRKMKLREKQKKGKKKMQRMGKVNIPQDVFLKMMRTGD